MSRKPIKPNSSSSSRSTSKPAPSKPVPSTAVRNTPIPRPIPAKRDVSYEMIAKRAYEIFVSGKGTDQLGNWLRAERELKNL
jgi:hypothetical protein